MEDVDQGAAQDQEHHDPDKHQENGHQRAETAGPFAGFVPRPAPSHC